MPRKQHAPLAAEFVKSILDYDPETGIFRWRQRLDVPKRWNTRYAGKIAGSTRFDGYIKIQIGKRMHYGAHILAWLVAYDEWCPDGIDHKFGDRSDNRIASLRKADSSANACNKAMQRNNKSGFVGVHFVTQCGKWEGTIVKNGARIWRKFFCSAQDAHDARQKVLSEIHGEFAAHEPDRLKYTHGRDIGH